MRLPDCERAQVSRSKVVDYLLSEPHPLAQNKSLFFRSFGFNLNDWTVLAAALVNHARVHSVVSSTVTQYGIKYVIEGSIRCPDGREPRIRSV